MKTVFSIVFAFLCAIACSAQVLTLPVSEAVSPGMWLCYRMNLHLNDEPSDVELRVAADSKYWLWVNGELQVREGGLKRGPKYGGRIGVVLWQGRVQPSQFADAGVGFPLVGGR